MSEDKPKKKLSPGQISRYRRMAGKKSAANKNNEPVPKLVSRKYTKHRGYYHI